MTTWICLKTALKVSNFNFRFIAYKIIEWDTKTQIRGIRNNYKGYYMTIDYTSNRLTRQEVMQSTTQELLAYYKNRIFDIVEQTIIDEDWSTDKLGQHFSYCVSEVFHQLFEPLPDEAHKIPNNQNSILDYNNDDLLYGLAEIYLSLCDKYGMLPLAMQFQYLTGITTETLGEWEQDLQRGVSRKRSCIIKTIRAQARTNTQQKLYNIGGVGLITLANNDNEAGLVYNRQRLVDGAVINTIASASLPQLAKFTNGDNKQ